MNYIGSAVGVIIIIIAAIILINLDSLYDDDDN